MLTHQAQDMLRRNLISILGQEVIITAETRDGVIVGKQLAHLEFDGDNLRTHDVIIYPRMASVYVDRLVLHTNEGVPFAVYEMGSVGLGCYLYGGDVIRLDEWKITLYPELKAAAAAYQAQMPPQRGLGALLRAWRTRAKGFLRPNS